MAVDAATCGRSRVTASGSDSSSGDVSQLIDGQRWEELYQYLLTIDSHGPDAISLEHPTVVHQKILHRLCGIDATPVKLLELLCARYPETITLPDADYHSQAAPLHFVCSHSKTSAEKVRVLLKHLTNPIENVLVRDKYGQTALHYACSHGATLEVIQELVQLNPAIIHVTTLNGFHPVRVLWDCYVADRKAYSIVRKIMGEVDEGLDDDARASFQTFWDKIEYLAVEAFRNSRRCPKKLHDPEAYLLHGLLLCNAHVELLAKVCVKVKPMLLCIADGQGNLPLHVLAGKRPDKERRMRRSRRKGQQLIQFFLEIFPDAAMIRNYNDDFPVMIAIRNRMTLQQGLEDILDASPAVVQCRDPLTSLYPFQLAAFVGGDSGLETCFELLRHSPEVLLFHTTTDQEMIRRATVRSSQRRMSMATSGYGCNAADGNTNGGGWTASRRSSMAHNQKVHRRDSMAGRRASMGMSIPSNYSHCDPVPASATKNNNFHSDSSHYFI